MTPALYEPPRPKPLGPLASLVRVMRQGDGDLLSLLPAQAYTMPIGNLGWSRRSIVIVNAPDLARTIMTDPTDIYPKNDLMVGALEPLVGRSIFVSGGAEWRRQRRMIDPAFSHIRIGKAFTAMAAAVDDHEDHLATLARSGEPFSLDLAMSHLTADIITRTVFSTPLADGTAKEVYDAFAVFEKSVAHVEVRRLIFDPPFTKIPHHAPVLAACATIRRHIGDLVDRTLAAGGDGSADIAAMLATARDEETGATFTRDELIDELGVFFLAGHETTASALTWAVFILATQPAFADRLRAEAEAATDGGALGFEDVRRLAYARNVFKETLRLYPPITFIPRVAAETAVIGGRRVKRGAMIMIAPWAIHRHHAYWTNPHAFDPDRFTPEREHELTPGAYMPFGLGPRVCVGANFATVESALILARLFRRFDVEVLNPERVTPAARLTTRPREQIMVRVRARAERRAM